MLDFLERTSGVPTLFIENCFVRGRYMFCRMEERRVALVMVFHFEYFFYRIILRIDPAKKKKKKM